MLLSVVRDILPFMQISNGPVEMIHFHGGPEAGKDTQAKLLVANDRGAALIAPGKILRDCANGQGNYGHFFDFDMRKLGADMKAGKYVDGVVLAQGIERIARAELERGKTRLVFTSWPREEASLVILNELIIELLTSDVQVEARHLYITASSDERRRRHQAGLHENKVRGRKTREDDTEQGFDSRDNVFQNRTLPFLERHWDAFRVIPVASCQTTHQTQEGVLRALNLSPKSSLEGQAIRHHQERK